jgi:hypothetical protein
MFLQNQRDRSAQSRHAVFMDGNELRRAPPDKALRLNLCLNYPSESVPRSGEVSK